LGGKITPLTLRTKVKDAPFWNHISFSAFSNLSSLAISLNLDFHRESNIGNFDSFVSCLNTVSSLTDLSLLSLTSSGCLVLNEVEPLAIESTHHLERCHIKCITIGSGGWPMIIALADSATHLSLDFTSVEDHLLIDEDDGGFPHLRRLSLRARGDHTVAYRILDSLQHRHLSSLQLTLDKGNEIFLVSQNPFRHHVHSLERVEITAPRWEEDVQDIWYWVEQLPSTIKVIRHYKTPFAGLFRYPQDAVPPERSKATTELLLRDTLDFGEEELHRCDIQDDAKGRERLVNALAGLRSLRDDMRA
jgi:hypothetical protein